MLPTRIFMRGQESVWYFYSELKCLNCSPSSANPTGYGVISQHMINTVIFITYHNTQLNVRMLRGGNECHTDGVGFRKETWRGLCSCYRQHLWVDWHEIWKNTTISHRITLNLKFQHHNMIPHFAFFYFTSLHQECKLLYFSYYKSL